MKRQRGRSRRNNNNHGNNNNRSLESNGPDVKVRGTAKQIFEKYETLASDAASSGNRVKVENYRQHAEHYLRIVNAQEAAKQIREENDSARQEASTNEAEENKPSDEKSEDGRSRRRYPPQARKSTKPDASTSDVNGDEPNDNIQDQKINMTANDADAVAPKKSTRRRKAPGRENSNEDTATEAAE